MISGSEAFLLYDTYGFPIDLTELIARWHDGKRRGILRRTAETKERSRNAAAVDTDDWVELFPIAESRFIGYDTLESDVRIRVIVALPPRTRLTISWFSTRRLSTVIRAGRPATAGTSRATNRRFRSPIPKRRTT